MICFAELANLSFVHLKKAKIPRLVIRGTGDYDIFTAILTRNNSIRITIVENRFAKVATLICMKLLTIILSKPDLTLKIGCFTHESGIIDIELLINKSKFMKLIWSDCLSEKEQMDYSKILETIYMKV